MQSFCTVMHLASRYQESPLDSSSGPDWCLCPGKEGVTGNWLSSHPLPISDPNLDSWSWSCPPVARICKLADCIPLWVHLYFLILWSLILVVVVAPARAKSCDLCHATTIGGPLFQHTIHLGLHYTPGTPTMMLMASLLVFHIFILWSLVIFRHR